MFDRAKAISTITLKFGLSLLLIGLVIGAGIIGVFFYRQHQESEAQQTLIEAAGKSVKKYHYSAFDGMVDLRTRYLADSQVNYDLTFQADAEHRLGNAEIGTITVEFLDEHGFSVHKQMLSDFVRACDDTSGKTICMGLESRGQFYLSVQEYERISAISVSHNLNLVRVSAARTTKRPAGGNATTGEQLDEKQLDDWDRKTEAISAGMTYSEMVAVAGPPRLQAPVEGRWRILYDPVKYKYGRIWVYFSNHHVGRVDPDPD